MNDIGKITETLMTYNENFILDGNDANNPISAITAKISYYIILIFKLNKWKIVLFINLLIFKKGYLFS